MDTPPPAPAVPPAAPPPAAPPTGFSLDTPLPADLPDGVKSLQGKTFGDLIKRTEDMHRGFTEATQAKAALEAKLAELQGSSAPEEPSASAPPETPQEPVYQPSVVGKTFEASLLQMYQGQDIDPKNVEMLSGATGINPKMIVKIFSAIGQEQANFYHTAAQTLGETSSPEQVATLMDWATGPQSPYNDAQIAAFNEFALDGETHFIHSIQQQYQKWLDSGGQMPQPTNRNFGVQTTPPRRPFQPTNAGGSDIYNSRAEFQADNSKAIMSNDQREIQRVRAKLQRTPAHIVESWDG